MRVTPALLVLALVTAGAAGACADDGNDRPAAGTVTVTLSDIEDSVGHDVAAVMFDGLGVGAPDARGIGGFGVEVDADPFSTTRTIATPGPIDAGTRFPYVSRDPLVVEPGEYTVMIWIAEGLGPYSRWVPADSPGLGGCRIDVRVERGRPTHVTVEGIPPSTGTPPMCEVAAGRPSATATGASTVRLLGDLSTTERAEVEWAVGRFAMVGLELPHELDVRFDTAREACGDACGSCRPDDDPPVIVICRPPGDTAHRRMELRMTLLHELAHVWHRGLDDDAWFDLGDAVGSANCTEREMVELVAQSITWGLMDTKRRPIDTTASCRSLYDHFVAISGVHPLGPLEPVCVPDAVATVSSDT